MLRTIERVFEGAPFHMVGDGFRVSNHFPAATDFLKRLSPFFLLDYHPSFEYPPTDNERRGVGPHPHRGFETVTLAYEGSVAHHDSAGNGGVIHPGDVQWMTAGSGVLHREYHAKEYAQEGGPMHMVQIWVNLPKKDKMHAPRYQAIVDADIPRVTLAGGAGTARVISGTLDDAKGPASTFSPARMLDAKLNAGKSARFEVPRGHNAAVLVLSGGVDVNGAKASSGESVLLKNDGDEIVVTADRDASVLVLDGAPIEEPLYHYGPFLMNTRDEINKAIEDYNEGRFGRLSD
jgi:redox-sensitive bicupin YhaK (pirin superfamily)